jgi:hypothetical protein
MGISPHGKNLVNTSETRNKAHFIDTETLKVVQKIAFKIADMPPEPFSPLASTSRATARLVLWHWSRLQTRMLVAGCAPPTCGLGSSFVLQRNHQNG